MPFKNQLADIQARPRNALLDFTRGSLMGVTTDVLGYPVDLATMALRPFGYNVENPVGGSNWLAEKFTSPTNSLAETAGRTLTGMVTPGPNEMLRMAGIGSKAPMQELTVYHGSPHRINNVDEAHPMGRFDLSKVGTGEGAQAYGHGIYLAENPSVAKQYQGMAPAGGTPTPRRFFGSEELTPGSPEYHAATLVSGGKSLASVRKEVASWIKDAETWDAKRLADPSEAAMLAGWKRTIDTLNRAKSKGDFVSKDAGHFYTVDLPDEHIANMLDWDAPLSEQPEGLRALLTQHVGDLEAAARQSKFDEMELIANNDSALYQRWKPGDLSGAAKRLLDGTATANDRARLNRAFKEYAGVYDAPDFLTGLERERGVSVGAALEKAGIARPETGVPLSNAIHGLGYPGIKYFDGGSRAAGEGTRNFVIFDGDTAKILKRE